MTAWTKLKGFTGQHWRGDYSLARSYWLHMLLLTLALTLIAIPVVETAYFRIDHVRGFALTAFGFILIFVAIHVWQMVGVWRSAHRHPRRGGRRWWAWAAKTVVLLNVAGLGAQLTLIAPELTDYASMAAYSNDPVGGARVSIEGEQDAVVHIDGGLGIGLTQRLRRAVDAHPHPVRTVALEGPGGRVVEARKLRAFIQQARYDTVATGPCYSSCALVFLGGARRVLSADGALGFHRSSNPLTSLRDALHEKKWMLNNGVAEWFAHRAAFTPNTDLWIPSAEELARAGVLNTAR